VLDSEMDSQTMGNLSISSLKVMIPLGLALVMTLTSQTKPIQSKASSNASDKELQVLLSFRHCPYQAVLPTDCLRTTCTSELSFLEATST